MKGQIVIVMPLRNAVATVARTIESFLCQRGVWRDTLLLIGNDSSTDGSSQLVQSYLPHPNIQLLQMNLGQAYLCRNFLNDFVRRHLPAAELLGRLDADDVLLDEYALARIEAVFDRTDFDVLLCGNKQQRGGEVLEWVNMADLRLLDDQYLLYRLYEMSRGNPKAELPSCNTFIKPRVTTAYPAQVSAEDHWFTVSLLMQKKQLKIKIEEELLYCIYSLDGATTHANNQGDSYRKSRERLYAHLKNAMKLCTQECKKRWLF